MVINIPIVLLTAGEIGVIAPTGRRTGWVDFDESSAELKIYSYIVHEARLTSLIPQRFSKVLIVLASDSLTC